MAFGYRAWVGLGILALAVSAQPLAAEPKVLRLAIRPDFLADDTVQKFEAETGIAVEIDQYESDDEILAGLRAGNRDHWDLAVIDAVSVLPKAAAEHLLQPSNAARSANYSNLDPAILKLIEPLDPGNALAVPYLWATSGLAVNAAKLGPGLPEAPADSLGLLFAPDLAAQAVQCGLAVEDSAPDVVAAALAYLGLDPASGDEHDLARAGDLLLKAKPYLKRLPTNDFIEALASGTLCVGFGSSISVADAQTRADERETGVELTYAIPRERARMWIDVLVIPASAAHAEAARSFIGFIQRPEIISDITDWTGAANPNILAGGFVEDEEELGDETVSPSAASRARLVLDKPLSPEALRARDRIWTKSRP